MQNIFQRNEFQVLMKNLPHTLLYAFLMHKGIKSSAPFDDLSRLVCFLLWPASVSWPKINVSHACHLFGQMINDSDFLLMAGLPLGTATPCPLCRSTPSWVGLSRSCDELEWHILCHLMEIYLLAPVADADNDDANGDCVVRLREPLFSLLIMRIYIN